MSMQKASKMKSAPRFATEYILYVYTLCIPKDDWSAETRALLSADSKMQPKTMATKNFIFLRMKLDFILRNIFFDEIKGDR